MKANFKLLSDIEHCLQRPSMYIGAVDPTERTSYLYKDGKFEYETYQFVPGLIKIIDEIIDNAVDVAIRTDFACNKIKVKITDDEVIVQDNGTGIPVELHEESGKYLPELAWAQMRTGTSFEDDRKTIGTNGLGSVACNIFSKEFIGVSDDGTKHYTLHCKNNLSEISHRITDSKVPGVTVRFKPDIEKFGLKSITEVHQMLVHQRLINLAITFPEISFNFNGKNIYINAKNFIKMFSDGKGISMESPNCIIGVIPNEHDDFKFYSYVNGISMPNGGTQVDHVSYRIIAPIREKLAKKYKSIKPGDIKNKIQLIVFMRNFSNPKFDSQTKERLTNSVADVAAHIDVDLDKIAQMVLRTPDIIDSVVDIFKMKEELKAKRELKGASKKKRIVSDKYIAPVDKKEILFLCEGQSAMGGISAILGRQDYGYYAMRGVPLNAYECTPQKLSANAEFKEIISILDLDVTNGHHAEMDFDKVGFATDADADGSHICGLLLGLFYKYGRNLFDEKKVYRLRTPIMIAKKKGKIIAHFFNLEDYRKWEESNDVKGIEFKYSKGLGSWKKEELQQLIAEFGVDYFLEYFSIDDIDALDKWLSFKRADDRKTELSSYSLEINKV